MNLKDFKVLARKILDTNGYENVGIRFSLDIDPAAWTSPSRDTWDGWSYNSKTGERKVAYPSYMSEYPFILFSKYYIKLGDITDILEIFFHEFSHLKRGQNTSATYKAMGRYAHEMDCDHDIEWMKQMWKLGYDGRPRFSQRLRNLQRKILKHVGFKETEPGVWEKGEQIYQVKSG